MRSLLEDFRGQLAEESFRGDKIALQDREFELKRLMQLWRVALSASGRPGQLLLDGLERSSPVADLFPNGLPSLATNIL